MRKLALILTMACLTVMGSYPVLAQSSTSSNGVRIKGVVQDAENKSTLPGAVVTLKYGTDSLQMATLPGGKFQFDNIPAGPFRLKISFIGYSPADIGYKAEGVEINMGYIQLVQAGTDIEGVKVVTQISMMTVDGDTIKYDPRAFVTREGDYAVDLVTKMPGIEVDEEGKITAHGKEVSWTLVDGKLIFGENAMTALENVKADNVDMVKVYDVANPDVVGSDLRTGKEDYQRVIDLQTKTKITMATDAQAYAGIGADIDREGNVPDFRYKGGGSFGLFTEKYMVQAAGYFNNTKERMSNRTVSMEKAASLEDMTSTSPGYGRRNSANLTISNRNPFNKQTQWQGSLSYSLSDSYDRNNTNSERMYLTPSTDGRFLNELSDGSSVTKSTNHTVNMTLRKHTETSMIFIRPSFTLNDNSSRSMTMRSDIYDQMLENQQLISNNSKGDTKSTSGSAHLYKMLSNYEKLKAIASQEEEPTENLFVTNMNASLNWRYNDSGTNGWRRDSTNNRDDTYISTQDGYTKYLDADVSVDDIKLAKWLGLGFGYNFTYDNSKTKRLELDKATLQPTPGSQSRLHTVNDLTNVGTVNLSFNNFPRKLIVNVGVLYNSVHRSRLEKTPLYVDESKNFDAILPFLEINNYGGRNSISDGKYFWFNYRPSVSRPSVEQMRDFYDNSDTRYITLGNPNLKQSYSHVLSLGYNIGSMNSSQTMNISANFSYTERGVQSRTTQYAPGAIIPGYSDDPVDQTTWLTTYDNLDGAMNASLNVYFSRPLIHNKFVLNFGAGGSYNQNPMYLNDVYTKSKTTGVSGNFDIRSNYSRVIEYRINASSYYSDTKYRDNVASNSHGFRQRAGASVDINFLKDFYFMTTYSYNYINRSRVDSESLNNLNMSIAYKFHKKAGEINFAVLDILNQENSYNAYVSDQYVMRSYQELMGRYYMVTLRYRFNNTGNAQTRAPRHR